METNSKGLLYRFFLEYFYEWALRFGQVCEFNGGGRNLFSKIVLYLRAKALVRLYLKRLGLSPVREEKEILLVSVFERCLTL
ncbi:hypothetical protein NQ317_000749 [Molorchus minor]|uniref:Maturase K n=1 Tax=Molorchus minor TaxID=1323400 RepID=A0ABQ9IR41_9CUCU|nr:hypothetical protein NQ317_000749 [Molorchus minor]